MRRSIVVCVCGITLAVAGMAAGPVKGDSARGGKTFIEARCATCHAVRGVGGRMGSALGDVPDTPNAMAGAMWTHSIEMWEAFKKAGIERPLVNEQQAADLYTFIMAAPQPEMTGNARRGRDVYEAKLCASCHDAYSGASRLEKIAGRVNAFWMMAAMWQHGGGMLSRIAVENRTWQTLSPREMADLIAFLNTRK